MAEAIRFLLGDEVVEIADAPPTTTVLDYLRARARRPGTKEGCAEGDCGACTVALGEPDGAGALRYRAVNSCLQLLPTLDGKQLLTIEDLAAPDGALHPVQQAMVDCHGSQCGFCTPGFVMSLFVLRHNDPGADAETTLQALAGNLCRCTGYRPILDAARRAGADPVPDRFKLAAGATAERLAALARGRGFDYAHGGAVFHAPATLDDATGLLARWPDAALLAGGTDFGLWVTKEHREFARIVSLAGVAELKTVTRSGTHLEIGAAVTWTDAGPALAALSPDLDVLVRRFGSVQIRNLATIGGNIANASPIGDGPPALLALGASVVLASAAGAREVALERFFLATRKTALAPGEVLARVRIPLPGPATRFGVYKLAKRFDQDISAVGGAFAIELDGDTIGAARVAYGGMAATPRRAPGAEGVLAGRPWSLATIEAAMAALDADFRPIDDFRASARYRRLAARNLLLRFYRSGLGDGPTQVAAYG